MKESSPHCGNSPRIAMLAERPQLTIEGLADRAFGDSQVLKSSPNERKQLMGISQSVRHLDRMPMEMGTSDKPSCCR